jgi:hypothetical protein
MEQFCSAFKLHNTGQETLAALAKWGLAEAQTMAMVYVYSHGRGFRVERDELWRESAATIQAKMRQLAKKVRSFHKLPGSAEYIASLKAHAAQLERLLSDRSYPARLRRTTDRQSDRRVAPLALMLAPVGLEFANSLERLPDVLAKYGSLLNYESARSRANPKLVRSRVLYLLCLAVRRAKSRKSDYQAHKSLAALLTPLRPEGVDYKAVANRITRFETSHPSEAEVARSVIAKSRAVGVSKLMLLVESKRGFLLYSED